MKITRDPLSAKDISPVLPVPYVQSITDVLSSHLGWHRARLKFMARFTSAVLAMTTTNLRRIAIALKAGVEAKSNYRRIQRFLGEYDLDAVALGRLLLHLLPQELHLLPQEAPYKVAMDRTEWHFGETPVNILVIAIAHKGMAFPVAWSPLSGAGSSGAGEQTDVLERFLKVVDSEDIGGVVADREFISVEWLRELKRRDIPFNIRLRFDRQVGLSAEEKRLALPVRRHAQTQSGVGDQQVLHKPRYLFGSGTGKEEETALPTRVVVRRIAPASSEKDPGDQFLILATSGIDPEEATEMYRRRWEILALFAALKSRGFDLEATHLTDPDGVENLIGLLGLVFAWVRLVGEKRATRHGSPPEKSHGRPARSLFRYGLDRLQSILTTPQPQPEAFFDCLRGLRSPTAFLSCT